ncbi:DMT family transporter, partial [Aeromonas rivipollensis]
MIPPLIDRRPGRPALGQTLGQTLGALAAFAAGLLLALMIAQNGALARATDPGSELAGHGVGTLVAALLWCLAPDLRRRRRPALGLARRPAGALTVVLAALCLNSPLGMAGTWPCCCSASCSFG